MNGCIAAIIVGALNFELLSDLAGAPCSGGMGIFLNWMEQSVQLRGKRRYHADNSRSHLAGKLSTGSLYSGETDSSCLQSLPV